MEALKSTATKASRKKTLFAAIGADMFLTLETTARVEISGALVNNSEGLNSRGPGTKLKLYLTDYQAKQLAYQLAEYFGEEDIAKWIRE